MRTKDGWFSIEAKDNGGKASADIYIFDHIGGWDISARGFIDQLKSLEASQINLHINSPGGAVFDGIAIQNSLQHHKANVTVYIDGIAASIASIIALAGDEIRIADNAYVMIHNPSSVVYGEAKDMMKEAEVLNKITDGVAGDYARKMNITVEEARELMDEETWYLGQEAVDAGFADITFEGAKATASFDINRVAAKAPAEALARFSQPVATQKNTTKLENQNKTEALNMDPKKKKNSEVEEETLDQATDTTEVDADQEADVAEATGDVNAQIQAALKADRKRQADIRAIGKKFGFEDVAEEYAGGDASVSDFQNHILAKSPDDWRASLAIKNPAQQINEQDLENEAEGADAVAKIKDRRKARYGS